jgi:hypothetical protein
MITGYLAYDTLLIISLAALAAFFVAPAITDTRQSQ